MAYKTVPYETLRRFCADSFKLLGFGEAQTGVITDVLLMSDLCGIESHGVQRLIRYYLDVLNGAIRPENEPEIVHETPVSAVVDGRDGMGQLVGRYAMALAIEKAEKSGIGLVTVRNSNHYGIAGYYAKMACDRGLIGMSCTNSPAIMVPTYGRQAVLGSNPIAVAVPAEPVPFLFDASTTVVTRGKIEVYSKNGETLPEGWAVDAKGRPTRAAGDVLRDIGNRQGGGILPLGGGAEATGGHKGYGYAMLCEIFSAILSLGETSNHTFVGNHWGICHGFAAIDPGLFGDRDAIVRHLSEFMAELRESPKAEGAARIYTHGEKEAEAMAHRLRDGIPVNDGTFAEFMQICRHFGLGFRDYFGFDM